MLSKYINTFLFLVFQLQGINMSTISWVATGENDEF
jgi:hypothetical protein